MAPNQAKSPRGRHRDKASPSGIGTHVTHTYEVCKTPPPDYTWLPTHAAWNLLRRIEQGNTTTAPQDAHALRSGDKIAVWWEEPDPATPACWYTAKVVDTTIERSAQHTVKYDQDNTIHTHVFMPRFLQNAVDSRARWTPAPPTYTPPCPRRHAPYIRDRRASQASSPSPDSRVIIG